MRLYDDQPSGSVTHARQLRKHAPEPELRLLRGLREALPDLKWRHQAPVGPFKVDIMCFAQRLVTEIDGDTHVGRVERDAARTAIIEKKGFQVIRFTNNDVMQNLDGVLTTVANSLSHREREGAPQARKGEGDKS